MPDSPRHLYRRAWQLRRLMFRSRYDDVTYNRYYWQLQNLRLNSTIGRRIYDQIRSVDYQVLGR